jgi:hypothetical protein
MAFEILGSVGAVAVRWFYRPDEFCVGPVWVVDA